MKKFLVNLKHILLGGDDQLVRLNRNLLGITKTQQVLGIAEC